MALKFGLLVLVEAQPGKGPDVWDFLAAARDIAADEPETKTWYAFKIDETHFGLFDTFETEEGRQAHLSGAIPAAVAENGPHMLVSDTDIRLIDLIAVV